jgi:hypothetical protein
MTEARKSVIILIGVSMEEYLPVVRFPPVLGKPQELQRVLDSHVNQGVIVQSDSIFIVEVWHLPSLVT